MTSSADERVGRDSIEMTEQSTCTMALIWALQATRVPRPNEATGKAGGPMDDRCDAPIGTPFAFLRRDVTRHHLPATRGA
jgi:hypothetical protein